MDHFCRPEKSAPVMQNRTYKSIVALVPVWLAPTGSSKPANSTLTLAFWIGGGEGLGDPATQGHIPRVHSNPLCKLPSPVYAY